MRNLIRLRTVFCTACVLALSPFCTAQGTRLWTESHMNELERGTPKGAAIASDGRLTPGYAVKEVTTTPSTFVWSLARTKDGSTLAGTGSPGAVLRIAADGKTTTLAELPSATAQALLTEPDGSVLVALVPGAKVLRLKPDEEKQDASKAEVVFDGAKTAEKPNYIWAMRRDQQGRIYIATGAPGCIYRITPGKAEPELWFKSDEPHIRSLELLPGGEAVAGSEGSGLVYKIDREGKGFVLFDAPKREIPALAVGADGSIYAANVGDRGKSTLPPLPVPGGNAGMGIVILQPASVQATGGSSVLPDGTDLWMLPSGGAPKKIWTSREDVVYQLAATGDGVLAFAGNRGHVYRIREDGSYADVAHLDAQLALAVAEDEKDWLVGTGNTGKLFRLLPSAEESTYTSDVFDANYVSTWGAVEVQPGSKGYTLETRSGNVQNPNRGWSEWRALEDGTVASPAARYMQWRAKFATDASLGAVVVNYLPVNAAPVIDEVVVVPGTRVQPQPQQPQNGTVNISFGGSQNPPPPIDTNQQPLTAQKDRGGITARWNAHDDNGDELSFELYYRSDDEKEWHLLKKDVTDRFYSWDAATMPDGGYRLKVVATDAPSHTPGEELKAERVSDRFEVDTTPPVILPITSEQKSAGELHLSFDAEDATSPIARAEYSLDGAPWKYLEPEGRLSDRKREHYSFTLHTDRSAEHVVTVRVYDRHENVATAKAVVK